ncbi:hypothetical protein VIGAN_04165800, partial [Vigna angularis var. angularis]
LSFAGTTPFFESSASSFSSIQRGTSWPSCLAVTARARSTVVQTSLAVVGRGHCKMDMARHESWEMEMARHKGVRITISLKTRHWIAP